MHQRIEDEHAEDHERRQEQELPRARSRARRLPRRRRGVGDRGEGVLARRSTTVVTRFSGVRPGRTGGGRLRGRPRGPARPAPATVLHRLAHDHELPVGESAHDVALVAERLDHHDRGRAARPGPSNARSSGGRRHDVGHAAARPWRPASAGSGMRVARQLERQARRRRRVTTVR